VTENGLSVPDEAEMPLDEALNDQKRVDYLKVCKRFLVSLGGVCGGGGGVCVWGGAYVCMCVCMYLCIYHHLPERVASYTPNTRTNLLPPRFSTQGYVSEMYKAMKYDKVNVKGA